MAESAIEQVRERLDAIYRAESGRILATLLRFPNHLRQRHGRPHRFALVPRDAGAQDRLYLRFSHRYKTPCQPVTTQETHE